MARLRSCGWEWNDFRELLNIGTGASPSVSSSTVRSGGFSLLSPGTAASAAWMTNTTVAGTLGMSTLNRNYYLRAYVRFDALPSATTRILSITTSGSVDSGVTAQITAAGKLQIGSVVAGVVTQQGSDSAATMAVNTWYCVEVQELINTGTVDTVSGRLDTVTVGSGSALAITDTAPTSLRVGWHTAPGVTSNLFVDDLALNDDTGAAQNTFPGVGNTILLRPASDNARTGAVAGAAGTTSLFDAVDNQPVAGLSNAAATITSQIRFPNNNATDNYIANLQTYTAGGIAAIDTINAIVMTQNIGSSNAADTANLGFQLTSNPVIAEYTFLSATPSGTSAVGTYPTGWVWGGGGGTANPTVTLSSAPVMEARKATANANIQQIDAMGLYVDYVPGTPKSFPSQRRDAMARNPLLIR